MQGRATVLVLLSLCFMENKRVKFHTNWLRDDRIINMLQFGVNAIRDTDTDANANANAGVRTIALYILRLVELKRVY